VTHSARQDLDAIPVKNRFIKVVISEAVHWAEREQRR
jgi:hypothetical protein